MQLIMDATLRFLLANGPSKTGERPTFARQHSEGGKRVLIIQCNPFVFLNKPLQDARSESEEPPSVGGILK